MSSSELYWKKHVIICLIIGSGVWRFAFLLSIRHLNLNRSFHINVTGELCIVSKSKYRYTQINSFPHPTCLWLSIRHHWWNFIETASFWNSGRARCCYRETFCWICVYSTSTYVYMGQNIKARFHRYPLVSLLSTGHWYRRSADLIDPSNKEDLFRIGFASPFVINDITINVMKPSCLTSV